MKNVKLLHRLFKKKGDRKNRHQLKVTRLLIPALVLAHFVIPLTSHADVMFGQCYDRFISATPFFGTDVEDACVSYAARTAWEQPRPFEWETQYTQDLRGWCTLRTKNGFWQDGRQRWYHATAWCHEVFEPECPTYLSYEYEGFCHTEPIIEPNHKQPPSCPIAGDPIIVATGNSYQTETDYKSQTPFGLNFVRYYNSSSNAVDKGIGNKWRHGFNRTIKLVESQAQVARSNGQTFVFNADGTNWVGDVDISDTLVELVDSSNVRSGWEYHESNDKVETYNTAGQLISISNRAGQSKTFSYDVTTIDSGDDNSDTLDKVVGFGGEEMLFSYDGSNRITAMTDPEGNQYNYSYDAAGNLSSVTYPDNTPLDDLDNPARTYHYENVSFPSHLTGLTDETGSRVTWAFDEEGRAISSELDSGVDKSSLDFSVADQVTVTNPLGKDTTYHFETLHGVKKVIQVEGHATKSCAGANQNYTYDANGYIESKTDWQGNVTTYVHNERGLEASRVEAFGTIEARTITTEWHDDFRLPKKITSPGQVTDFVYDEKGRLLSQTTHDIQP
jgi:YD repeat-containing protein